MEVHKPIIAIDKDKDVPEFGGYAHHELRQPELRKQLPDVLKKIEVQAVLKQSALKRALYFGYGIGEVPPVHFPNAEHFQHVPFTNNHWLRHGNMESEFSRINFMLEKYNSRLFPNEFIPICLKVLDSENVLQEWNNQIPIINMISSNIYERIALQMEVQKVHDDLNYSNGEQGAYQTEPIFYDSSTESGELERKLWEVALSQIGSELRGASNRNISSFLHLYARIKDPITPIRSILPDQVKIFRELFDISQSQFSIESQNFEKQKILISQLALESSFLALPSTKDIDCVIYGGHHELPYIYIDMCELPRGEFANPNRVIEIIDELIDQSEKHGQAVATPITVSYIQEPNKTRPELFIIDGNNRATAILLMKFINFVDFSRNEVLEYRDDLRRFISLYDLDIEWERDLAVALKSLSSKNIDDLLLKREIVQQFANAKSPALLVQEPNFHTVAVAQSKDDKIVLLQPMHQAIYNEKRRSMAIPSKQQSHGRAAGNDINMSLKRMVD